MSDGLEEEVIAWRALAFLALGASERFSSVDPSEVRRLIKKAWMMNSFGRPAITEPGKLRETVDRAQHIALALGWVC